MGSLKEFRSTSTLFGANAPFIEELYENYLASPDSVPPEWRSYFDELRGDAADVAAAMADEVTQAVRKAYDDLLRDCKR